MKERFPSRLVLATASDILRVSLDICHLNTRTLPLRVDPSRRYAHLGGSPMEAERFDRLIGAVSTRVSRRRGVAALLGGLVAALPALDLDAKRRGHTHDQGKTGRHKRKQQSDRSHRVAPSPG